MSDFLNPDIENAIRSLSGQNVSQSAPASNNTLELIAMAMDKLGSGIDPKNPAAGIATAIAQSKIADRARQQESLRQKDMLLNAVKVLGGFTEKGTPGINSLTTTTDVDGNPEHTIKFNTDGFNNAGINSVSAPTQLITPTNTEQKQNVSGQTSRSNFNLFPFF